MDMAAFLISDIEAVLDKNPEDISAADDGQFAHQIIPLC